MHGNLDAHECRLMVISQGPRVIASIAFNLGLRKIATMTAAAKAVSPLACLLIC
jgi:hypothetical protein